MLGLVFDDLENFQELSDRYCAGFPSTEDFSDVFLMMKLGVYLMSETPKVKALLPIKDID